jgi:integrase
MNTSTLFDIPSLATAMPAKASQRHIVQQRHSHAARFEAVRDSRKRKVPGLWRRGSNYYAQMRVELGDGRTAPRRFALDAITLDQARAELEKKRTEKRGGQLPLPGHRPKFEEFSNEYLSSAFLAQKKPSTQRSERQAIARWENHLGGIRIDKITPPLIHSYREKRLVSGRSARTVNLDVVALRHVLRFATERELIKDLPKVRALKQRPPQRRPLLTKEQFTELLNCATDATTKNSAIFRYYIRLLALTGAREQEALKVRRSDVDFERGEVTIGAGGVSKNSKSRTVDFSPELETLLRELTAALPPDTNWLFPSPQRGAKDIHAKTLRESFNAVRKKAAGLESIGFHDLRHFFASQCVMAGIDFMTIAAWLGHSDGGILVGKVYGHLADTHKHAAARKLRFFG